MPHDTKMVSMKIDPKEREERYKSMEKPADGPMYPYGLALHLEDEVMEKLKMSKLPQVGKQVLVYALADVTSVSENESMVGGTRQSVSLQITDLALLAPPKNEESTEEALYSKA